MQEEPAVLGMGGPILLGSDRLGDYTADASLSGSTHCLAIPAGSRGGKDQGVFVSDTAIIDVQICHSVFLSSAI